jgi:hypothetical protein
VGWPDAYGARLNLNTAPAAEASAVAPQAKLQEFDKVSNAAPAEVAGEFDVRTTNRSCESRALAQASRQYQSSVIT